MADTDAFTLQTRKDLEGADCVGQGRWRDLGDEESKIPAECPRVYQKLWCADLTARTPCAIKSALMKFLLGNFVCKKDCARHKACGPPRISAAFKRWM